MVEGAALEMLCGETHPGFESLTLRQKITVILIQRNDGYFMSNKNPISIVMLILSTIRRYIIWECLNYYVETLLMMST